MEGGDGEVDLGPDTNGYHIVVVHNVYIDILILYAIYLRISGPLFTVHARTSLAKMSMTLTNLAITHRALVSEEYIHASNIVNC